MRFTTRQYEEYMASPDWQAKRARALKKHGRICKACGSTDPGLHVHHHTYDRFSHERLDDLVILCKPCHDAVHKLHNRNRYGKGPTLSLTEVTFAFIAKANPTAYSAAVMADHTPAVPSKPKRTDGKRAVSLDRRSRPVRKSVGSMSGKALRANRGKRPGQ